MCFLDNAVSAKDVNLARNDRVAGEFLRNLPRSNEKYLIEFCRGRVVYSSRSSDVRVGLAGGRYGTRTYFPGTLLRRAIRVGGICVYETENRQTDCP